MARVALHAQATLVVLGVAQLDLLEVGVGDEAHAEHRAFGRTDRGERVVILQGDTDFGRADTTGGEFGRLQPDAHRKYPTAEHVGALHAFDRGEPRLHHAVQIIGDLVLIEGVRVETQVSGGELAVGGLDVDRRRLGSRRQFAADLVDLGADLGKRRVGVVVEPEKNFDRADAGAARGFDVVDTIGAGDDALELRGDVAAYGVGAGTVVDRGDIDHRAVAARILAGVQLGVGDDADDQNDDVHHQRDDRLADEQIGETFVKHDGEAGERTPIRYWQASASRRRRAGPRY